MLESTLPSLAILGIGMMGQPVAKRLCQAGYAVHVWNRTYAKAQALTSIGAVAHRHAAEAVAQADIVLCWLQDGAVVEEVLFEQIPRSAWRVGACCVDMSSIEPDRARRHAALLEGWGVGYLDAPVSGGTLGAETGQLTIMVGGDATTLLKIEKVLLHLGRITLVGGVGSGQMCKLANQMIVGMTLGAVAEALLLCQKAGIDLHHVMQALQGGFADSRILQVHGQRMVEHDFAKRGSIAVQHKDLLNALKTAQHLGIATPMTFQATALYGEAMEQGLEALDQSAVFLALKSLPTPAT